MKSRFLSIWEILRSSYWFVPLLMSAAAVLLAYTLLHLDQIIKVQKIAGLTWVYAGSAAGARSLLSTVASSIITVAGVTFSITITALSLASSQFGPRLLRGFLRDTGNQIVLGTFIATFVYCLLVLRTIRGTDYDAFVPNLAITGGVALSLMSVGVLIYFINHVSTSIQASHVIASVSEELNEAIARLFPGEFGAAETEDAGTPSKANRPPFPPDTESCTIVAKRSGYIQLLDQERLLHVVQKGDLMMELLQAPGAFVAKNEALARVWPKSALDTRLVKRINGAFIFGPDRTMAQDAAFGVDQLVELAARALSPGINDPFTAMMCLDRLGDALGRLAECETPSSYRYDKAGTLRIVVDPVDFPDMVNAAFDPIRQYGAGSSEVIIHLLKTLTVIAARVDDEPARAALRRQADLAVRGAQKELTLEEDRAQVAACQALVNQALNTK